MRNEPSNTDDIIDSRDIIARIEELESILEDLSETTNLETERSESADGVTDLNATREELEILKALAAEGEAYAPDWRYGETLIQDSYFTNYTKQLAEDIGAIDKNANWPLNHIDWQAAAAHLQQDYTEIDFNGVAYWIRSC